MSKESTLEAAANKVISEITKLQSRKSGPLLVALDGRSGTGKSTLANLIAKKIGAAVVVGDDFYSGGNEEKWQGWTPQAKADGAIDWRRMRKEVLDPLLAGGQAVWHPLDFKLEVGWVGWKEEVVTLDSAPVVILDGAYSSRPELADIIDLATLIETPDAVRRERLLKKEGEIFMGRWHKIWDEAEDYYFSKVRPRTAFDLVVDLN